MSRIIESKIFTSVIWVVGVALRIWALLRMKNIPLVSDAKSYHDVGVQIAQSEKISTFWPPGLPYYLSIFSRICGGSYFVSMVSMLFWYLVFTFFMFLCVNRFFGKSAANISLLVFSIFPTFIYHSVIPLTQMPAAACIMAIAYLTSVLIEKQRICLGLFLGLFFSILVLIRPSSILLVFVLVVFLSIKKRKTASLISLIVLSISVSLWLFKAHSMESRFVFINDANSTNLFYGNNPYTPLYRTWWYGSHSDLSDGVPAEYLALKQSIDRQPVSERYASYRRTALEYILHRPDLFIVRSLSRVRCYFAFPTYTAAILFNQNVISKTIFLLVILIDGAIYSLIVCLMILYHFDCKKSGKFSKDNRLLVILLLLCYALPYWVTFSHPTYNLPIIPLLWFFSLGGIINIIGENKKELTLLKCVSYRTVIVLAIFLLIQFEWIIHNFHNIQ